jgi:hypothetical protein
VSLSKEITKYKLDIVGYRRSDGRAVAQNQQEDANFYSERGIRTMNIYTTVI